MAGGKNGLGKSGAKKRTLHDCDYRDRLRANGDLSSRLAADALWIFGAALIFSPVLHPWYILWILPLACWRRAWPWAVFAISVWLCKISFGAGIGAGAAGGIGAGALHPPVWVRGLEVLPALLAIAFFYWKNWSNHKKKSDEMQPTESL